MTSTKWFRTVIASFPPKPFAELENFLSSYGREPLHEYLSKGVDGKE